MKDLFFANERTVYVQWRYVESAKPLLPSPSKDISVITGTYTTAQARVILLCELEKLGERVLYADTDSIIFVASENDYVPSTGVSLGQFTDEVKKHGEHAYIEEFVAVAPKSYALKIRKSPDSDEYVEHVKMKGYVCNSARSKKKLNFECFKNMLFDVNSKILTTKTTSISRRKHFKIVTEKLKKKIGFTFTKRVVLENGFTLPFGHVNIEKAID